ncbi:Uncharacterized protein TPAR_00647 [Tolypocladium paradoxum]|uniref:Uncharacterized protein n=1 Tax=Tolypocladium paradoxum TaxID=94208 RepID=A0A2S4L9Q3_9HYPO|nr:Uncharacterized protein TPAR_00647 [Tolypocladium paradoxum]
MVLYELSIRGCYGNTCCIDKTAPYDPIIAMLIHYGDGRRACVGQYRMDWHLTPSQTLRIGLGKTRKNWSYVAKISLRGLAAAESDSLSWIDIAWHGKLEWFSQRQCKLCYSDYKCCSCSAVVSVESWALLLHDDVT